MKTVAVLGASYGGSRAAQLLASQLPDGWRVVVVDRNSHMNHLYVLPRFAVIPGHEHKAFIPYPDILKYDSSSPRHLFLHARVTAINDHSVTLSRAFPEYGIQGPNPTLHFDFVVYALGSHLPSPINLWGPVGDETQSDVHGLNGDVTSSLDEVKSSALDAGEDHLSSSSSSHPLSPIQRGTKSGGITWLKRFRQRIERTSSLLVVGGGALGIQYATDIAEAFPTKHITLLHSRSQLLPRFNEAMHDEILSSLASLNITTILNERLDLSYSGSTSDGKERVVRTLSGREIRAEVVLLCTGQTPNTALVREFRPDCIVPDGPSKGFIRVKRTMQVAIPTPTPAFLSTSTSNVDSPLFSPSTSSTPALDTPISGDERTLEIQRVLEEFAFYSVDDKGEEVVETEVRDEEDENVEQDDEEDGDEHLQVAYPHMFAIGDAADSFGAINAGHNAYFQADVAAKNILKLIRQADLTSRASTLPSPAFSDNEALSEDDGEQDMGDSDLGNVWELLKYRPGPPAIKISLGLTKSLYQFNGEVGTKTDVAEDLDAALLWKFYGVDVDEEGMYA